MSMFSPYRFLHSIHNTSLNVTFTPASRRDLPPACLVEHHQRGGRSPPGKLAPWGAGHQGQGQSQSWRCCCELLSGRNMLHGLISMAESACSFGAFSCAGLWSERKASSTKAELPRNTYIQGWICFFSSSGAQIRVRINSTEDNGAKPTQVKGESDGSSKKHLFPLLPRLLLLQIYKSLY